VSGRIGTAIGLGALLVAGPLSFAEIGWASDGTMSAGVATGTDSNVFLSKNDSRSSTFLQTTFNAGWETAPTPAQRLSLTSQGFYKHYFRFGEADQIFADAIVAYRYALTRSLLLGLIPSTSYNQLQLLDTEGNVLPRDHFIAYNSEVRGYLQVLPNRVSRLTFAGGVRRTDVRETTDAPSSIDPSVVITFPSLDNHGYFATAESGVRNGSGKADLSYEYAVTHYEETQANNRDTSLTGTRLATNPLLVLVQHTARLRLGQILTSWVSVTAEGQMRWNVDPFEGDLTYRQMDGKLQGALDLWRLARWTTSIAYRTRIYAEQVDDSGASDRRERFLTLTSSLQRQWTGHLSSNLQYQVVRKTSNVSLDQFAVRIFSISLDFIL